MTTEQAYIDGFCKVAEYHGIDPEALAGFAKEAAVPLNLIGEGLARSIMRPTWSGAKGLGKAIGKGYHTPDTIRNAMKYRAQDVADRMQVRLGRINDARSRLQAYHPLGIPAREEGILNNLETIATTRLISNGGRPDRAAMERLGYLLKREGLLK